MSTYVKAMKFSCLLSLAIVFIFSVSSCHGLGFVPHRLPGLGTSSPPANRLSPSLSRFRGGGAAKWTFLPTTTARQSTIFVQSPVSRGGGARDETSEPGRRGMDFVALAKYGIGFAVQMSLIFGVFYGMDLVIAKFAWKIPSYIKFVFFYLFNTKTAIFSPLKRKGTSKDKNFKRPGWTPPGFVFAIMWPVFVFGIRAFTASRIVWASGGVFATRTLMTLMVHLGFGNLWNTVNNVERRLGFAVPVLYGLLFSNLYASYAFYQLDPLAGKLLASTSTWLAAAAALETHVWQLNPDPATGKPEPLYPAKDPRWKSQFRWEK